MAITTEKSTQVTNADASPVVLGSPRDNQGRVRIAYFSFTQGAAAGDIASTQTLVRLPAGNVRVLGALGTMKFSAFGAARTLNVGYTAHTDLDGTAVAASAAAFMSAVDVSGAGAANFAEAIAAGTVDTTDLNSQDGVDVQAIVAGATIPAGATLAGYILYVTD